MGFFSDIFSYGKRKKKWERISYAEVPQWAHRNLNAKMNRSGTDSVLYTKGKHYFYKYVGYHPANGAQGALTHSYYRRLRRKFL